MSRLTNATVAAATAEVRLRAVDGQFAGSVYRPGRARFESVCPLQRFAVGATVTVWGRSVTRRVDTAFTPRPTSPPVNAMSQVDRKGL